MKNSFLSEDENKCKNSGRNANDITMTVDMAFGMYCQGRWYATIQLDACTVVVIASSVGRIGPRTVLKPAQPKENEFSISCSAQHEDDNNPIADHQAYRYAVSSM